MKNPLYTLALGVALLSVLSCLSLKNADLSGPELLDLARTVPRHNSFRYITSGSLGEGYFTQALRTLEDPAVYIVLSNTRSPAGKLIGLFTGQQYNHVSLAFDRDLQTLVSYNGGSGGFGPGLNRESREELRKFPGSSLAVYRLPVSRAAKQGMIDRIERINAEGSSYNLLGLVLNLSFKPNIMFCSQFVYSLLGGEGIRLFEEDRGRVKPMDFVLLDQGRKLSRVYGENPEGKKFAVNY
ncbi:MAG: hypothetical protein LBH26_01740 [Treponema sp.]|jgi:hypothetical protein|nr:hypothetical protein [Treponema sp.]